MCIRDRVRALREEVEEELMTVHKSFTVASALMSSEALEQALLYPKQSVELTQTTQNIMSVNVPVYHFQTQTRSDSDIYPYGFAATSGELDTAVEALGHVFRKMLKLAEIEKSAQLMAEEIEKTRRRVNALEYVMIPNTQEAIRYINMKLDEKDVYKRQLFDGGDVDKAAILRVSADGGAGLAELYAPTTLAEACLLYTSLYRSVDGKFTGSRMAGGSPAQTKKYGLAENFSVAGK